MKVQIIERIQRHQKHGCKIQDPPFKAHAASVTRRRLLKSTVMPGTIPPVISQPVGVIYQGIESYDNWTPGAAHGCNPGIATHPKSRRCRPPGMGSYPKSLGIIIPYRNPVLNWIKWNDISSEPRFTRTYQHKLLAVRLYSHDFPIRIFLYHLRSPLFCGPDFFSVQLNRSAAHVFSGELG